MNRMSPTITDGIQEALRLEDKYLLLESLVFLTRVKKPLIKSQKFVDLEGAGIYFVMDSIGIHKLLSERPAW